MLGSTVGGRCVMVGGGSLGRVGLSQPWGSGSRPRLPRMPYRIPTVQCSGGQAGSGRFHVCGAVGWLGRPVLWLFGRRAQACWKVMNWSWSPLRWAVCRLLLRLLAVVFSAGSAAHFAGRMGHASRETGLHYCTVQSLGREEQAVRMVVCGCTAVGSTGKSLF